MRALRQIEERVRSGNTAARLGLPAMMRLIAALMILAWLCLFVACIGLVTVIDWFHIYRRPEC